MIVKHISPNYWQHFCFFFNYFYLFIYFYFHFSFGNDFSQKPLFHLCMEYFVALNYSSFLLSSTLWPFCKLEQFYLVLKGTTLQIYSYIMLDIFSFWVHFFINAKFFLSFYFFSFCLCFSNFILPMLPFRDLLRTHSSLIGSFVKTVNDC